MASASDANLVGLDRPAISTSAGLRVQMASSHEEFRQLGFVVARGVLPRDAVEHALAGVASTVRCQLEFLSIPAPSDLHCTLKALFDADLDRYKRVLGALWRKSELSRLMRHQALFDYLEQEFGWRSTFLPGGDVLLLMAPDLKIPGGYFGLGSHQDYPSVQGSLDGVVVWIPLTSVGLDSFPLEVVPASHLNGLITDVDKTANGWVIADGCLAEESFKGVVVEPGDAVFMSYFVAHRSGLKGSRLRLALSTRIDNADEPTFVDRAYPTAYQRNVIREQIVPDFPTVKQIVKALAS